MKPTLEQKPVAWMHNFIAENVVAHRPADLERHPDRWAPLYKDPTPCQTCEALARAVMMDQTSHDTPPQRGWQGLTKREFNEAVDGLEDLEDCWTAIEAKLREKNT